MKVKQIIILALAIVLAVGASAQKNRITEFRNQGFTEQMLEYLNQATSDKEKKAANETLMKSFGNVYNEWDLETKDRYVEISNVVLKLKVRQLPDVYNFIATTVLVYNSTTTDRNNFNEWLKCIEFIQSRNKKIKDFTDYIEFTGLFLTERTLFKSRSCTWQTQQGTAYRLQLEGNEIVYTFDKPMELYYSSGNDNGTIYGTKGKYYYFDFKWLGEGGRLNWDRTGLPATVCWADLNRYEAITKFPKFSADSVRFTNSNYFSTPIYGHVEEALSAKVEPEKYSFPKFRSYQRDFRLTNILPDVDYSGSFMMNGAKFITSDVKNPATLIFHRQGHPFITVQSTKFTITASKVVSENASIKVYLDGDSITNNGIMVRYNSIDKQVILLNSSKRNYYSPYRNTYHNLDMYCEQIVWKMADDVLDMSMLGQSGDQTFATFESRNYYSEAKFRKIQGIDQVNPIMRMYKYIKERGMTYDFFVDEFAQYIHMDIMQAKLMVHNLAGSGLVSFNEQDGKVYVQDKLVDYAQAYSKSLGKDYDAIAFESDTRGLNAQIDLNSNALRMHGVEKFVLSDSQKVVIYPLKGDLEVQKNRDLTFSGRVDAGRFIVHATNVQFSYDKFNLNMPQIDSMFFYVTKFNNPEEEHIVYTPLYHLVGDIQIDRADNHNGLKQAKEYPIFNSHQDCFVYYDSKQIHGGTYDRNRFYYTVHPFQVKDMDGFKTDSLKFNGELNSAGIFPTITEPLSVQRDYSLGFIIKTPRSGFPAYGGKGQYKNLVSLSNQGFRGQGTLSYLSATLQSKEILFTPDSMRSTSDTFFVHQDATFPEILNGRCSQHWFPYQDSMRVDQLAGGSPFKMYQHDALLNGSVVLRPQYCAGYGAVTIGEGTVESPYFTFMPRQQRSNVTRFTLLSEIYNNTAFYAEDMKSFVDYDKRYAEFQANKGIDRTNLPLLQYAAEVDKFTWHIDKKLLDLQNSQSLASGGLEGLNIRERFRHEVMPGARFVSTDPSKDSLQFRSIRASYLYNEGHLSCKQVFLVNSADAVIAPGGDSLHIRRGGTIDLIKNGSILASRTTKYHVIRNADIMLQGGMNYTAKGYIDYIDENEKSQPIYLTDIAPQNGITVGNGFIADSANFTLNQAFGFAGKVRVEADKQFYYFDGGVRLLHNCAPADQLGLLAYASYLDPKNIRVPVPEIPTDWKGNRITASILFDRATFEPRMAFLTNERAADNELMGAHGFLFYDSDSATYIIASDNKLNDPDGVVERYLTLNTQNCTMTGEGPINFNVKSNYTKLNLYGSAVLDSRLEETELNSVMAFSFPIDEKVLTTMAQLIAEDLRLSPSSPDNEMVRRAMIYYQGPDKGAANYSTYVSTGYYERIPEQMESTILLEGVKWKYAPGLGYYYNGVAGLAAIGKKQLHLNTRVKAQLYRRGQGTYLTLYLQVAGDHWYYFNYEFNSQSMTIYSSVGEWIDMIKTLSVDKRTYTMGNDIGKYRYRVGTSRVEVPNFLLRIESGGSDQGEEADEEEEEENPDDMIPEDEE